MKKYVYQVKHTYVKNRKKDGENERKINKYFLPYTSDLEDDKEIFYAIHFNLPESCSIIKATIDNVSKVYNKMSEKEREEEELVKGLTFEEIVDADSDKKHFVYVPTEEALKDFCKAQLCFSLNGYAQNILFINAANGVQYYAKEVLDECCGEIVRDLLSKDIIYKKICNL